MAHEKRRNVSTALTSLERKRLRTLLDRFIADPEANPVAEHLAAGADPDMHIHHLHFLQWHQGFISKCELWMLMNGGERFVPLPYWDPKNRVPAALDKDNNTSINVPLPAELRDSALHSIRTYRTLNNRVVPFHNAVHDALGGNMPDPLVSPSDPIFWPLHAYLVRLYERWKIG